jgi:hypothetical protein
VRRRLVAVAFALAIAIITLARGYWFASTHGTLYVLVLDFSDPTDPRPLAPAELAFLDSTGRVLAHAVAEAPLGSVYVSSPPEYACRDVERRAAYSVDARRDWGRCFDRQSRWLATWVRRAKFVDVTSGSCSTHRAPILVTERVDAWWLWWVPLRHIGGPPFTCFQIDIRVDRSHCTIVPARDFNKVS